jgi:hypothetical protein
MSFGCKKCEEKVIPNAKLLAQIPGTDFYKMENEGKNVENEGKKLVDAKGVYSKNPEQNHKDNADFYGQLFENQLKAYKEVFKKIFPE